MTPSSNSSTPGVTLRAAQAVIPFDSRDGISVRYQTTASKAAGAIHPSEVPPFFIGMAHRLAGKMSTRIEVDIDTGPGTTLSPFRFREKGYSVALQKGARTAAAPQSGLLAAMAAREAAIEGRDLEVDDFATAWLGLRQVKAPEWREAISTALLTDWRDALGDVRTADEAVLSMLRSRARVEHLRGQPVWVRRTGNRRTLLLDMPVGNGVLGDVITSTVSPSPEDAALSAVFTDARIAAVLQELGSEEQSLAQAWAGSGDDWRKAAVAAGLPAEYGERLRRKLKRLGARYAARAQAAGTRGEAR